MAPFLFLLLSATLLLTTTVAHNCVHDGIARSQSVSTAHVTYKAHPFGDNKPQVKPSSSRRLTQTASGADVIETSSNGAYSALRLKFRLVSDSNLPNVTRVWIGDHLLPMAAQRWEEMLLVHPVEGPLRFDQEQVGVDTPTIAPSLYVRGCRLIAPLAPADIDGGDGHD
jgi:hypothetical protein